MASLEWVAEKTRTTAPSQRSLRRQERALRRWEKDQENPYHPLYEAPNQDRVDPLAMDHLLMYLGWLEQVQES